MAIVTLTTTRGGLVNDLEYAVNKVDNTNLVCRLFTNDATIQEDMAITDLTEATQTIAIVLDGANWSVVYTTRGEATYGAELEFNFSAAETIYGAYLTDLSNNVLIAAGKFAAPRSVDAGDTIKITSIQRNTDNA